MLNIFHCLIYLVIKYISDNTPSFTTSCNSQEKQKLRILSYINCHRLLNYIRTSAEFLVKTTVHLKASNVQFTTTPLPSGPLPVRQAGSLSDRFPVCWWFPAGRVQAGRRLAPTFPPLFLRSFRHWRRLHSSRWVTPVTQAMTTMMKKRQTMTRVERCCRSCLRC